MSRVIRATLPCLAIATVVFASACTPDVDAGATAASSAGQTAAANLMPDLVADISVVGDKFVSLAKEFPADKYTWRPGDGVRSVGELMLHVAADNYLLPAMLGIPVDSATGIKGDDYNTAVAFERRALSRDTIIAELERSFAFLKQAMSNEPEANLSQTVSMFGSTRRRQEAWILTATHLHEHLGQGIAYARINKLVPPWSK